jgi:hypothetical protein
MGTGRRRGLGGERKGGGEQDGEGSHGNLRGNLVL